MASCSTSACPHWQIAVSSVGEAAPSGVLIPSLPTDRILGSSAAMLL
jgi:hypothetical protein